MPSTIALKSTVSRTSAARVMRERLRKSSVTMPIRCAAGAQADRDRYAPAVFVQGLELPAGLHHGDAALRRSLQPMLALRGGILRRCQHGDILVQEFFARITE